MGIKPQFTWNNEKDIRINKNAGLFFKTMDVNWTLKKSKITDNIVNSKLFCI